MIVFYKCIVMNYFCFVSFFLLILCYKNVCKVIFICVFIIKLGINMNMKNNKKLFLVVFIFVIVSVVLGCVIISL